MKQRTPLFYIKRTRTASLCTPVQTIWPIAIGLAQFGYGLGARSWELGVSGVISWLVAIIYQIPITISHLPIDLQRRAP